MEVGAKGPTSEYQDCSWEKDWCVGFGEGTTNMGHQPISLLALSILVPL